MQRGPMPMHPIIVYYCMFCTWKTEGINLSRAAASSARGHTRRSALRASRAAAAT